MPASSGHMHFFRFVQLFPVSLFFDSLAYARRKRAYVLLPSYCTLPGRAAATGDAAAGGTEGVSALGRDASSR